MSDWFRISILDLRTIADTLRSQVVELKEQLAERDVQVTGLKEQLGQKTGECFGLQIEVKELKEQLAATQLAEEPPEVPEEVESPPTPITLVEIDNFVSELRASLKKRE